jgi:predicted permease
MRWLQIKKRDEDLDRELRSDLELEEEEQRERGLPVEEARFAALRALGNLTLIKEHAHETWGWVPFENLIQDFRHTLRQLRRSPGFVLAAVVTLGVGLGAASAIFCLMDTLWFHPMPVPHSDQLVRIFSTTPQDQDGDFSYPEYLAFADRVKAFQSQKSELVAIGGRGSAMPQADGTSILLLTNVVSSNFFDVLGVRPIIGRLFAAEDGEWLRVHPGVVLGYRCWQRNFAGNPNIVGHQISLVHGSHQQVQVDVWGVLPPSFREINPASDRDLWLPTETWAAIASAEELISRDFRWFHLLGRLGTGATVASADGQVAAAARALATEDPSDNRGRSARVISDFHYRLDQAGTSSFVLFSIVIGVVLLSIINTAHLLLARALSRGPEVALRLSLGASRWTIARQLLIENALLGLLSLTLGLGLAALVAAYLPHMLGHHATMLTSLGPELHFHIDLRAFTFAASTALLMMLLLALLPLTQAAQAGLLPALHAGGTSRTTRRTSMHRRVAIWGQIGISFAVLVSNGALVRSFVNTLSRPIGITRNEVLVVFTQQPEAPGRGVIIANFNDLPGVQRTAYAIRSPLMPSEGGLAAKVTLLNHPELRDPIEVKYNAVSPGFLDLIGTHIVLGRGFTSGDDRDGPPVVVISQAMARKYWGEKSPIGQLVRLPAFDGGQDINAHIIGIAEDAPIDRIGEISEPYMYLPFHLSGAGEITFVLRTGQKAMSEARDARQILIHADSRLDPIFVTSLPELILQSASNYEMMAELVTALGILGLTLTVVGLYGFLAFRVTQRRREIGIRMALGASRNATAMLILGDTVQMSAIGLIIGLVLSVMAAHVEAAVLFGVNALDGLSIVGAFCALAFAMLCAAWLPARRAASVEPIEALRYE